MKKATFYFGLICIFFHINVYSQSYNLPLEYFYRNLYLKYLGTDTVVHTVFEPLQADMVNWNFPHKHYKNKFLEWLFNKNQVVLVHNKLHLYGNLLFDFYKGRNKGDTNTYWRNTRGFQIFGYVGNRLSFYTDFYENQEAFLPYIYDRVEYTDVIPGRANWKDFKDYSKDFNYSSGYISFDWTPSFNIQLGQSKFFIGDGYRSLFLSDNSYSYPFLKFDYRKGNWRYISIFTEFTDFRGRYYAYHIKRHSTINVLSFARKHFEFSLLEGILWHTSDDSTYIKRFPFLYFIPIPFLREPFILREKHNFLLGINLRFTPLRYFDLYGQFVLDKKAFIYKKDFWAYQAGVKFYDLFFNHFSGVNLFVSAEYNYAAPYMYFGNEKYENWVHYNQPLAHVEGADFKEFVLNTSLKLQNLLFLCRYGSILTDEDTTGTNFGKDLFKEANGVFIIKKVGEKNPTFVKNIYFKLAYIVNYHYNFEVFVAYQMRKFRNNITQNQINFVFFGIKTNLSNFYYDF